MATTIAPSAPVTVRPWRDDDLPTIRHITWETWKDTYGPFIPIEDLRAHFEEHYTLEAMQAVMAAEHFTALVAVRGDEVVGYAKIRHARDEQRLYVGSLYILPEHQGCGAGRTLMRAAETKARELGLDRIWLGVMSQNEKARGWYERRGFEFIEEKPYMLGRTSAPHLIGFCLISR